MTNPHIEPTLSRFLAALLAVGDTAETIKMRRHQLSRLHREIAKPLLEATTDDLVAFLGKPHWSRSTKRSHHSALRTFYEWAVDEDLLQRSPMRGLAKPRADAGRKREPASDIAVAWGLRSSDPRVRLMTKLGARCGLRPGEVSRVDREDVFADLLGWSLVVKGKGGKRRVVPMPDELASEIRAMPPGPLFPGQIDGRLSPSYVSKLMSHAMPEGQTGHMLRHRRAAIAFQETGNDLRAVQELLGHASVATTQVYVPVRNDQLRRAVGGAL